MTVDLLMLSCYIQGTHNKITWIGESWEVDDSSRPGKLMLLIMRLYTSSLMSRCLSVVNYGHKLVYTTVVYLNSIITLDCFSVCTFVYTSITMQCRL